VVAVRPADVVEKMFYRDDYGRTAGEGAGIVEPAQGNVLLIAETADGAALTSEAVAPVVDPGFG
jgi:hypothetical protein